MIFRLASVGSMACGLPFFFGTGAAFFLLVKKPTFSGPSAKCRRMQFLGAAVSLILGATETAFCPF